jgi:DNA-binding response OmpR family regulator
MRAKGTFKVLIADDERGFLKALATYLSAPHREIITASSGTEALEVIERDHPDVVITDLVMPGCDGLTVLRKATSNGTGPLVILMTGYGSLDTAVRAMKEGAFDYKAKPFLLEEMELCLARAEQYLALLREKEFLSRQKEELAQRLEALESELLRKESVSRQSGETEGTLPIVSSESRPEMAALRYKTWEPRAHSEEDLEVLRRLWEKGLLTFDQWKRIERRLIGIEDHGPRNQ